MAFIYICSAYGGLRENAIRARHYGKMVAKEGNVPIIPHVMWHGIFEDNDSSQRQKALNAGLVLLKNCDELRYFGKEITAGMAQEIAFAKEYGIPVKQGYGVTAYDLGELYRFFEKNFLFINHTVAETINDYVEQGVAPELIKEAIIQTAKKNAGVSYMEAILNNWVGQRIFTLERLLEYRKGGKKQNCSENSQYSDMIEFLSGLDY